MKQHVMSFLLSEGLFEAAKSFSEEANIPSIFYTYVVPEVDEKSIWARYEIRNHISKGEIDEAFEKIKIQKPNFE